MMMLSYLKIQLMHYSMLIPFYSHCYTLQVSALQRPSSGSTDSLLQLGKQNVSRSKYKTKEHVLFVTWQL